MKYAQLTTEQQTEIVQSRIRDLEREHYFLSISLGIAEAKLETGMAGAEKEVMELNEKLKILELSLTTLGKLAR